MLLLIAVDVMIIVLKVNLFKNRIQTVLHASIHETTRQKVLVLTVN